jgi:16S rRNA (adenine1518-N6/adenine1519-N6)-dimethyltransferase
MNEELRDHIFSLMKKYSIEPQERFSQNFLVDAGARDKIIGDIPFEKTDEIVEIGPGLGSLTEKLVNKGRHVTAIEFDRDMIRVLTETIQSDNFTLVQGDILKQDLSVFHVKHTAFVGNLPYSISRDIIRKIAVEPNFIYFGFMVQQEVADKMFFKAGSPLNNPFSVFLALRGELTLLESLHPGAFYPSPRPSSSFISLKPTDGNFYASEEIFAFLALLFRNPRKNLSNNLKGSLYQGLLSEMKELGIDERKRPHELLLPEYKKLIKAFNNR